MLTGTKKGGRPGNSLALKPRVPHPRSVGREAAARHLVLAANQTNLSKQPPSNVGGMKRFLPSHRTWTPGASSLVRGLWDSSRSRHGASSRFSDIHGAQRNSGWASAKSV